MPFLTEDQLNPTGAREQRPLPQPTDEFFGDLVGAAATNTTSYGMLGTRLADNILDPAPTPDPSFDALTKDNLQGYENYAISFIDATSEGQAAAIKRRIDREQEANAKLAGAGWAGIAAQLAVGLTDPVNFIPVGGEATKAYQLGRIGKVIEGAGHVAAAGAVSATANELIAQGTQGTRTVGQSAEAIGAATLLGGVLGGAAGGLAGGFKSLPEVATKVRDEGKVYADAVGAVRGEGGSVGAAAVQDTTLKQETLIGALGLEKLLKFQDPVLNLANSPAVVSRRIGQQLAEQPLMVEKNAEGIATPIAVESRIRQYSGGLATANEDLEDAFIKYRLGRDRRFGDMTSTSIRDLASSNKMDMDQFAEEVGKAMRRGDQHEIPEVAEAAKSMRENVFDPLKDEAIKNKLLPEDVKPETADSYLTRVYDVPKIVAQRHGFEAVISNWLKSKRDAAMGISEKDAHGEVFARLTDGDLRDVSADITNKIIGNSSGRLPYKVVALDRGPLKDRTLGIDDVAIEPWLEHDVRKVSKIYTRTMSSDVELTRAFGRADMKDQLDKIMDNYKQLREGVTEPAALTRLQKQEKSDLDNVEGIRDRLRGTYALPAHPNGLAIRAGRVVKSLNFLRLLGGMTLSSLSDVGSVVVKTGIMRAFGDGIVPMVSNFKKFRLAADEVKLAGNALDMVLDERNMSWSEVTDQFGRTSKFERGLDWATHKYGLVTLMAPWNAAIKQWGGVISQTRMLKAIENMAGAAPKEIRRLAHLGIDAPMAAKIAKEFKTHGSKDNGVYWANTADWTNHDAAVAYRAAFSKELNAMVVTPGQDKPFWMSTQVGGLIGQFHSFSLASTQRVLLSGLQQRDMAALSGTMMMMGLGALSYWAKRPDEASNAPMGVWLQEGIDRSGLTGWLFDVNNIAEKALGNVGVSRLTGRESSRYASRNVLGAILGPTTDVVTKTAQVASDVAEGKMSQSDTHAMRQMLPLQNVFYLKWLFDRAEEGVNQAMSIPKHSAK